MEDRETQANIAFVIKIAGTSFSEIDRKYRLARGRAYNTLRRLDLVAERAIITELRVKLGKDDLRVHPYSLWPRRYRDDGTRLPKESLLAKYRNPSPVSPRQKSVEAQT